MPHLSGITIYPVKSLDGISLSEATVLPSGALMHDRRWRLVDVEGAVVNAKKNVRFHGIRATFGIEGIEGSQIVSLDSGNFVTLSIDKHLSAENSSLGEETFPLLPNREGPCEWLSEALATEVFLQERFDGGFPDDRDAAGLTLISTESLREVARWFDLTIEEARRRFRMNLEVAAERDEGVGVDSTDAANTMLRGAFWEDSLASPVSSYESVESPSKGFFEPEYVADDPRRFQIGSVLFQAAGVCRRCSVPERNSLTGASSHLFRDQFEAFRMRRLPFSVDASDWTNFYHLGINTTCKSNQGSLEIGQAFQVIEGK
ncbi:MAG: MOSC domain-containing protein [Pirellulales bacterium]